MIRFLSIHRFAVIDSLQVEFEPGLNVLTGETGAGKSMVVDAIALLLGGRSTASLVRTGADAATIQAIFDCHDGREVVVRREISAQGRSRAFVDDLLMSAAGLREVTRPLVDLHGQHDHQVLLDPASHLDLLDDYGALVADRAGVAQAFAQFRSIGQELARLRATRVEGVQRAEFLRFQLEEVDRLAPRIGEEEELGALLRVLANAERLQRTCAEAYQLLYEGEGAALPTLSRVWKLVAELSALDPAAARHLETRSGIQSQLEDLAFHLRSYGADIDTSPERLKAVEDRLASLERLKRKHRASVDELVASAERWRADLAAIETSDERLEELERAMDVARRDYLGQATHLSARRREAGRELAARLEGLLADLAMERTRCEIRWAEPLAEEEWGGRGIDAGSFYLSPNPGEALRPLDEIASGGELSRIMLALRTLGSTETPGKTLVFDEVDAGIGGRAADVVGARLRELANRYQVICVTHLPQIASYATAHFHLSKDVRHGRTVVEMRRLDQAGRAEEIARMIGGGEVSARLLASAREMLARGESEINAKGESERARRRGSLRGQKISD